MQSSTNSGLDATPLLKIQQGDAFIENKTRKGKTADSLDFTPKSLFLLKQIAGGENLLEERPEGARIKVEQCLTMVFYFYSY